MGDMGRGTEGELCVWSSEQRSCQTHHEDRRFGGRGDSPGDDKRIKKDWVLTRSILHLRGCVLENHCDQDS